MSYKLIHLAVIIQKKTYYYSPFKLNRQGKGSTEVRESEICVHQKLAEYSPNSYHSSMVSTVLSSLLLLFPSAWDEPQFCTC